VRALAVVAVTLALAACVGAPRLVPAGPATLVAGDEAARADAPLAAKACPKKRGLIFASDNTSLDLYLYCGPGPRPGVVAPGAAPLRKLAGVAGWGLAVEPGGNKLAVGQSAGTIAIYALPALGKPLATLKLRHGPSGYVPYGLGWDTSGGLYATEWPAGYLDYWPDPVSVQTPSCIYTMTTMSSPYYVAAHGTDSVDVYGINDFTSAGTVVLSNVVGLTKPGCSSQQTTETQIATLGTVSAGTGFPGGIATNGHGDLVAGNQLGFLYDMGPYPGAAKPVSTCTWTAPANDYTALAFDARQTGLWLSNVDYGSSLASDAVDVGYPLPAKGACVTPGPSGGPTLRVTNAEFLSVAVWRNAGQ
jgi:hypothetical protein